MEPLSSQYKDTIQRMMAHSAGNKHVSIHDVYQEGNRSILPYIDAIIADSLEPGSGIRSFANIEKLAALSREGSKCLLLVEHYSNFDLPVLAYLLRKAGPEGERIADAIVAIAGIKLSESNPVVSAFSEAYSRLVIYPSRSMEELKSAITDPMKRAAETMKANAINLASMKELARLRTEGKLILVFPAGTRFRPWDPSSKRGVREIDSYIRSFDYMSLVSINGNILRLNPEGEMSEDILSKDRVVIDISEPLRCDEFRNRIKHQTPPGEDKKQATVDAVMAALETMHEGVARSLKS
ncbi:MAG: 1-acyl-sn-glycerol-3-phosphate acyltransferase [Spirochaetales bacterium]|nr:1-acyl-sn-glycerol-3-phosphate acyltransferase [Spirochaetales bacterium]